MQQVYVFSPGRLCDLEVATCGSDVDLTMGRSCLTCFVQKNQNVQGGCILGALSISFFELLFDVLSQRHHGLPGTEG